MSYLRVHLKVCEGCGGLWFRAQDRVDVYCSSCAGRLRGFPRMVKRRLGRPRKHVAPTTAVRGGVQ